MIMDLVVRQVSCCTVKPPEITQESLHHHLNSWDLSLLPVHYIQVGLLFNNPPQRPLSTTLQHLKHSLSITLTHFFPLSGRLVVENIQDPPSYSIFLDCKHGAGTKFVHAIAEEATVSDILSISPLEVESLFPLNRPVSFDGHTLPLLAIQVTELVDGIFIACSFNHVVGDGNSFWNFFNTWSQVCRLKQQNVLERPPITNRWLPSDHEKDSRILLPYSRYHEFSKGYDPEPYTERVFHFTSNSIAQLKAKANAQLKTGNKISSFQALAAFLWRAVTRARCLPPDQETKLLFLVDDRSRLDPPLPRDYFGNCILPEFLTATAGDLLSNQLGWSAWMMHERIAQHTTDKVHSLLETFKKDPFFFQFGELSDSRTLSFGMSHKFDVYTNDFGWGEPLAVRTGYGIKFDGKVTMFPGRQGGGSMDLEICLFQETMTALESDNNFINAISPTSASPALQNASLG